MFHILLLIIRSNSSQLLPLEVGVGNEDFLIVLTAGVFQKLLILAGDRHDYVCVSLKVAGVPRQ